LILKVSCDFMCRSWTAVSTVYIAGIHSIVNNCCVYDIARVHFNQCPVTALTGGSEYI
jgi:hypothetical protein